MEMKKIYDGWSEHQKDHNSIRDKWCEIDRYLYEQCSDSVREVLEGYLMEFGVLTEEAAFYEGYKSAFRLWIEILM